MATSPHDPECILRPGEKAGSREASSSFAPARLRPPKKKRRNWWESRPALVLRDGERKDRWEKRRAPASAPSCGGEKHEGWLMAGSGDPLHARRRRVPERFKGKAVLPVQ
uniref:Uncharacterized protein n=1 Tax=Mycena chlorophos TaxID=658473 RepID=A0ABQ0LJ28_MYCCL|nr:predicted protein [Mycena chlorophos]